MGESTFELAHVGGIALLRASVIKGKIKPTRFVEAANFLEAKFYGVDFSGAQFEGPAIFSRVSFDGQAFFGTFRGAGKALATRFGSYADFVEAKVQGRSEFIDTEFGGFADFGRVNMQGTSTFFGAHFSKEASFQGARFLESVSFHKAHFIKGADLSRMRVDNAALFQLAIFSNKVDLRDSYIATVFFRDELIEDKRETRKTEFATSVDLRGLNYERIHADWDNLMDAMDPYDRQPYVTLEKFFRAIGRDRQAELVYLKRRHTERKRLANLAQRSRQASQWLQWVLFNYGVRPFRLLGFSFVILVLGVFMFTQPGAVRDKEDKSIQGVERLAEASSHPVSRTSEVDQPIAERPPETDLKWPQALGVSLRLFIPIVELPTGSRWVPSENAALEIQPKLLRALQEREFERLGSTRTRKVDVRMVAATNRDLEGMIAEREFRSDLYYRLNVFPIRIPPLRERREDIALLTRYFVQKFARQMQKQIETIPAAALKALTEWEWPGNVRELQNFIERSVILTRGKALEAPLTELQKTGKRMAVGSVSPSGRDEIARIVRETISEMDSEVAKSGAKEIDARQREEIERVLGETKGRVGGAEGAAARLGINRTTLLARMKKLGIDPKLFSLPVMAST